jgi:hypothetical protein
LGKYKWNLGMGGFCGLVALLKNFHMDLIKKFHTDLNEKETQINKCFLSIDYWKVFECDSHRNGAGQALERELGGFTLQLPQLSR